MSDIFIYFSPPDILCPWRFQASTSNILEGWKNIHNRIFTDVRETVCSLGWSECYPFFKDEVLLMTVVYIICEIVLSLFSHLIMIKLIRCNFCDTIYLSCCKFTPFFQIWYVVINIMKAECSRILGTELEANFVILSCLFIKCYLFL